jgi:transcriptional regulator
MRAVYVPPEFRVDEDTAWGVVRDAGAGMLVISTPQGLESVFVPVIVSDDRRTLMSHVARANSWWRSIAPDTEVLALFLAASTYVTPSYYPSREQNPNVVPTWNYVAAEVRGTANVHLEPEWKRHQVGDLTRHFEHGRDPEWRIEEADERYRDRQLNAIVGVEIAVASIVGKAKLSQNRSAIDRDYVRDQFASGSLAEQNVAERMA